jgi:hypothetical protein
VIFWISNISFNLLRNEQIGDWANKIDKELNVKHPLILLQTACNLKIWQKLFHNPVSESNLTILQSTSKRPLFGGLEHVSIQNFEKMSRNFVISFKSTLQYLRLKNINK